MLLHQMEMAKMMFSEPPDASIDLKVFSIYDR